ncbi:alpha/beta fold hydrolase [Streptomyces sp. L-9-10]|uniref:alpha/beta fold hydrolase n=1 Tax=Streptomyces sp. L-9-10 TaxID=1478131 RepID=UPI001F0286DE|nr:alpha/beta fold hydrolase [Streptomyces sp. L-9-10]
MPESTTRARRDIGHYVNDELRDRYFAACDVLYAKGAPIRSETDVETSFGTTHVYRYGPSDPAAGSRTPVVLIHGSGGCSAQWYPNTVALSADRPVYALDTPGDPGRSIQREPMWQPERAAQWMDEALGALGLDKVHLVGSSYGGWLVINQSTAGPNGSHLSPPSTRAGWRRWGCASSSGSSPASSRRSPPRRCARPWRSGWSNQSSPTGTCVPGSMPA